MLPQMSKEIEVGGHKYIVTHPDPETAFKMGMEFSRLIGEPISALAGAGGGDIGGAMQTAAKLLLQKLEPDMLFKILKKTLLYVELQKDEDAGDKQKMMMTETSLKLHFQGRHGDMLQLFVEAVAFQQADFFLAVKRTLTEMMMKMKA
jgi:hypothetical protein